MEQNAANEKSSCPEAASPIEERTVTSQSSSGQEKASLDSTEKSAGSALSKDKTKSSGSCNGADSASGIALQDNSVENARSLPSIGSERLDASITLTEHASDEVVAGFVIFQNDEVIKERDLVELLKRLPESHYDATKTEEDLIYSKCKGLFEKDYRCEIIDNQGGVLSMNYPIRLPIPISKRTEQTEEVNFNFDPEEYTEAVRMSRTSRCRTRFVVPVMIWMNKFVCRSGTLSVRKGAIYETAKKPEDPKLQVVDEGLFQRSCKFAQDSTGYFFHKGRTGFEAFCQLLDVTSMESIKKQDCELMKKLGIKYIFDLMVEDRKMFQNISVSSSEKVHRDIYSDFGLAVVPFPGCEFFRNYKEAGYNPEGLTFDWSMPDVNARLELTNMDGLDLAINLEDYKEWNLVQLTQNYLKLMLTVLARGEGGLLVHCISGWDRTPLFISLLRVSLWADEAIHCSLSTQDITYLTLAYDWYLFGHNLPTRLKRGEEIMHFCFKFLPYISSDDYSVTRIFNEMPQTNGTQTPEFKPGVRAQKLLTISNFVLRNYDKYVTPKE